MQAPDFNEVLTSEKIISFEKQASSAKSESKSVWTHLQITSLTLLVLNWF